MAHRNRPKQRPRRDGFAETFVLIKLKPVLRGEALRDLLSNIDEHTETTDEFSCASLPVASSSGFLLLGISRDAPASARARFEALGADHMRFVAQGDVVVSFAPFLPTRNPAFDLVVLDTDFAPLLDVALGISRALYPARLVSSEDDEAPLDWLRRTGNKPGVHVSCPSGRIRALLLSKAHVIVDHQVCRVVDPVAQTTKAELPKGPAAKAAKPTYKEAAVGVTATKVEELLAPLSAVVSGLAVRMAATDVAVGGIAKSITAIIGHLDGISRSLGTNNDSVAALQLATASLERQVLALKLSMPTPSSQHGSGPAPMEQDADEEKRPGRGPFKVAAKSSAFFQGDAPARPPPAPQSVLSASSRFTPAPAGAAFFEGDGTSAPAAAPAASAKPAPAGPETKKGPFFARKTGAAVGAIVDPQGKRAHSSESDDESPKRRTRGSPTRLGGAIAYQQSLSVQSNSSTLHALTVAPITFYRVEDRLALDPGNSMVVDSFFDGFAKAVDAGIGTRVYDVHDLLQRVDCSLSVCSNGQDFEEVNGGAPFFTVYRTGRLDAGDLNSPPLLAFHVRNDTSRAKIVSLLPPPPEP